MSTLKSLPTVLASLPLIAGAPVSAKCRSHSEIRIEAPVERIWSLVTDVDNWPHWNPEVQSAHLEGDLRRGSRFKWKSKGSRVTSTFRDIEPMTRLTWTGVAFGTKAVHSWTFETTDRGVLVTTTETFDGWLPALAPRMMQKTLDDTLPALLASLKAAAEHR